VSAILCLACISIYLPISIYQTLSELKSRVSIPFLLAPHILQPALGPFCPHHRPTRLLTHYTHYTYYETSNMRTYDPRKSSLRHPLPSPLPTSLFPLPFSPFLPCPFLPLTNSALFLPARALFGPRNGNALLRERPLPTPPADVPCRRCS
jgi:hypothetical protein